MLPPGIKQVYQHVPVEDEAKHLALIWVRDLASSEHCPVTVLGHR